MEILANLCESVLWIVFLKIFCRPKYSRKIDFPGAVTAVLLLMASIGFSDQFALFSQYTVLIDFVIAFGYTMLFLEGMWYWKLFLIAVYNVALLGSSVLAVNTFVNLFHVDATVLVTEGNPLRIAMIVTAVIMAMGIAGGIEKANRIMMPLLFVMLLGLGIYIFTLPGSEVGYQYIFTIKPQGLLDIRLWIYAFGQAFFSLSIAGNGTVIYGSYLNESEDVVSSARNVAIFDTLSALLAAFVIIPGMAVGGAELSSGGPGLMFIYLINVFNGMPGGKMVGMIFYVCVLFAGMSSLVNLYEAPVATLQEKFGLKRAAAVGTIAVTGCVVALVIQGIVSGWMDAVSIYICPLGAMLAAIMFFWVAGKDFALDAVNRGRQKQIGAWFIPLGKYILVPLAFVALVAGAVLGGIG